MHAGGTEGVVRIHPIKKHHVASFVITGQSDPKNIPTYATKHPLMGERGRGREKGSEGGERGSEGEG